MFVADHRPKAHEWLPAIRQDHQEAGPKIEVVPNRDIVLEPELGPIDAVVLCELHVDKTLGIGKLMNIVRIKLWNKDPETGTKRS